MVQVNDLSFQCYFLHSLLVQASQLLGLSVDVTLAANRLIRYVLNMMDKIKYW